ncbi:hypothetical protein W911_07000 [Hyphomicrobium nitrativorans NL23]|uniref:Uncharacterized protein n=1 Tax=Hyphomicrobium nitrativorans NL23 TaxID=1029756 RepID=V5SHR1_9HYPH|nr:hypothetical protein [Hyphomicrobium nitrativorans]AHB50078.1 hypothetical protein W911_07000 [Hyphomicrobium nitrativorans NL23]
MAKKTRQIAPPVQGRATSEPLHIPAADLSDEELTSVQGGAAPIPFEKQLATDAGFIASKTEVIH